MYIIYNSALNSSSYPELNLLKHYEGQNETCAMLPLKFHIQKIFWKNFDHGRDIFRAELSDFRCCNIASTLMMLLPRLIYELIIHLSEFFSSMLGVQLKYKRYYIMELQFIPNFNSLYVCQLFKIF